VRTNSAARHPPVSSVNKAAISGAASVWIFFVLAAAADTCAKAVALNAIIGCIEV
jgi:hypothetical protein